MGWEDYAAGAALATEGTRKFNQAVIEARGPVEALKNAFKGLGVESAESLRLSTDMTLKNLETIKNAFQAGQATTLDYAKSLKAALSATEKVTGPDTTKQLADLMAESEKKIAGVSFEDPERKQKIAAMINDWANARNEIQALAPVSLIADIPKMEAELTLAKDKAKSILGEILPDPIAITVDTSQLESAFDSARSQFESLKQSLSQTIEINVKATVSSSPKVPFSQGIENMIAKFGTVEKAMKALELNIGMVEFKQSMAPLLKELAKVRDIVPSIKFAQSLFPTVDKSIDQKYLLRIKEKEDDILSKINLIKMQMSLKTLGMYKEFGSFQSGTDFVPRTGLYMLHRGEQVKRAGDVNMGGITIESIQINGNRGKEVAEELIKTLKYHTSRELKSLIG
jgi:hypothetical protein